MLGIFLFECKYQLRRPWFLLLFAALLGVTALFVRTNYVADQLYEDYFANAPFLIASATVFGGLLWLLAGGRVAGEAAGRDVSSGIHPLTYTTPVSKRAYLGGRFLAALTMNAVMLAAVQIGIALAVYWPGVSMPRGPFRLAAHVTPYLFVSLANAFVATALQFALALRSGRPMAAYFGSFLLFFTGFFISAALLFWQAWGALLDPIGIRFIVEDLGRQWTPVEKNVRLLSLDGVVLQNRALWTGVGLLTLALAYTQFRFEHRGDDGLFARFRARRRRGREGVALSPRAPSIAAAQTRTPVASPSSGVAIRATQVLAIGWGSFRYLATSWAGLVFFVVIPLLSVPVVVDQMASGGARLVPVTALVIAELTGSLADELSRWLIVPAMTIYFAGELVWRERDAALSDITDALPGSDWIRLVGQYLGLSLALTVFSALLVVAGMLAQVILEYHRHELALYLQTVLGLQLAEYVLFAGLALVVHAVVFHKYGAHMALVGGYVFIAMPALFGVEHPLLIFGAGPAWSYTEMRGFGRSLGPWAWFRLYWASWLLLMAVATRLLWVRGQERRLARRLQTARQRWSRATAVAATIAIGGVAGVGGFIVYNTNWLNPYVSASALAARQAEYERRYGRYARVPQPQIVATGLNVDIHAERGAAEIKGTYRLTNHTGGPIRDIHIAPSPAVTTAAITLDRPATLTLADGEFFHRIYVLERPLAPGDSLQLAFDVRVHPRGFRHDGISEAVGGNGTHLTNAWLPAIGYQPNRELTSASDRHAHGLPSRPLIAPLDDQGARGVRGSGTTLDVQVGTSGDQVAVAPGALTRTWVEGRRRYFHYVTDGPVSNEYAIFSARYAVHEATWRGEADHRPVSIRVLHHPGHSANLESLVLGIRASLDYYTRNFGDYPYGHLTVVERAGNAAGMHADSSVITFTEGSALWKPAGEPGGFDFPMAVVAHEMAHQWTVPYAAVEGAPVLSEGVAWYYAMKAVEQEKGRAQLEHLLEFMRQPHVFPPVRRGEPLLRGVDGYASYRRGPFALFALSEYGGANAVDGALRRLRDAHRVPGAPLATMNDLYRHLQTALPSGLHPLLRDLFAVNAYWDLETERVSTRRTAEGVWEVHLTVDARKRVFGPDGAETEVPMDDLVQVGVFDRTGPLHLRMHRLATGQQRIRVVVPRQPDRAGVDPNHLLLEMERGDNMKPAGSPVSP